MMPFVGIPMGEGEEMLRTPIRCSIRRAIIGERRSVDLDAGGLILVRGFLKIG
jgi:hypothetical protein